MFEVITETVGDEKLRRVYGTQDRYREEHRYFGVQDKFGRAVGAFAWHLVRTAKVEATAPFAQHSWDDGEARYNGEDPSEPEKLYGFRPSSSRNGDYYGASQSERWFADSSERSDAIEAYYKAAEKRATRAAAKAKGGAA